MHDHTQITIDKEDGRYAQTWKWTVRIEYGLSGAPLVHVESGAGPTYLQACAAATLVATNARAELKQKVKK